MKNQNRRAFLKESMFAGGILFFLRGSRVFSRGGRHLPRVLIIGDSISIGYTPFVKKLLAGKAGVFHNRGNAQDTWNGLNKLDRWLGRDDWDVIHFNWGLWDLCYRHPDSKVYGRRDKRIGTLSTSLVQYEINLGKLVRRLKQTRAKLIWASTTPVPVGETGRFIGDDLQYNAAARRIMQKYDVRINDFHAHILDQMEIYQIRYGDVHFTKEGYRYLAEKVAREILEILTNKME